MTRSMSDPPPPSNNSTPIKKDKEKRRGSTGLRRIRLISPASRLLSRLLRGWRRRRKKRSLSKLRPLRGSVDAINEVGTSKSYLVSAVPKKLDSGSGGGGNGGGSDHVACIQINDPKQLLHKQQPSPLQAQSSSEAQRVAAITRSLPDIQHVDVNSFSISLSSSIDSEFGNSVGDYFTNIPLADQELDSSPQSSQYPQGCQSLASSSSQQQQQQQQQQSRNVRFVPPAVTFADHGAEDTASKLSEQFAQLNCDVPEQSSPGGSSSENGEDDLDPELVALTWGENSEKIPAKEPNFNAQPAKSTLRSVPLKWRGAQHRTASGQGQDSDSDSEEIKYRDDNGDDAEEPIIQSGLAAKVNRKDTLALRLDKDDHMDPEKMADVLCKLERKLSQRPSLEELEERNILRSDYSEMDSKARMEARKRMLLRKLSFRPTIEELKERQIIKFNDYVEVTQAEAYDRRADKPWTRLTPKDKAAIRRELNEFKSTEMDVHQESRQFTRYHRP